MPFLKKYFRSFALRFLLLDEYKRLNCRNKRLLKQIFRYPGRAEYPISLLHFFKTTDEVLLIDVGANVGNFANAFKQTFPNTHIIAFEPATDNFNELSKKFSKDPTVNLHRCAISNEEKMLPLYLQGECSEQNTLEFHPKGAYGDYDTQHEKHEFVSCKTLDSFNIQKGNRKLCLKVDVEGHDIEVFEGAKTLLNEADVVIVEANFINMHLDSQGKRKPPSFSKLVTLCEAVGLYPIIFHIFGDEISNYAFRRDVIFVKEALLDNVLFFKKFSY